MLGGVGAAVSNGRGYPIRRGRRAATRRKRDDLMPAVALAFADIRRDAIDVVIEFRSETPLD